MKERTLTAKVFMAIVMNDMVDALAQLLMKKGLGDASGAVVGLGILVYALNFFLWILILSRVDLSIAMPVGSTTYLIIPFLSMVFLHEHVGFFRWAGVLLIMGGIYLVSKSTSSRSPVPAP